MYIFVCMCGGGYVCACVHLCMDVYVCGYIDIDKIYGREKRTLTDKCDVPLLSIC